MSYKIKTSELLKGLQQTIKVVPTRSTLPILSCALFDFGETLKISATKYHAGNIVSATKNVVGATKRGYSKFTENFEPVEETLSEENLDEIIFLTLLSIKT